MFTKSLAAAALAGVIGVATLGLSTGTASAGYWVGGGYWGGGGYWSGGGGNYNNYNAYPSYPAYPGNNYYFSIRPRPYYPVQPTVQQVCKPIYKTVQIWKPYYGWVWQTVYAGQRCWYQQSYPSYSYGNGGW
jgi:hypothetical protein